MKFVYTQCIVYTCHLQTITSVDRYNSILVKGFNKFQISKNAFNSYNKNRSLK